ncbi:MAG: hypothetical protein H7A09_10655 [Oceanospirillaceae bacterium]|nr:hypothetical protein [Oceanospirillaceae bacterium]
MSNNELTLNRAQVRSILTPAPIEVDLWGRGTGKSTLIGFHSQRTVHLFPRCTPIMLGVTYSSMLTITLAEVVGTWERLGYREGIHFMVRKKPPAKWRWPKPLHAPVSYDNFIAWYNGSGFYLASQDAGAPFRGGNGHGLYADEAALLDKTKLDEQVRPAIRGDYEYFKRHPLLHFEKYTSSKPIGDRGKWLEQMGSYYQDEGFHFDLITQRMVDLKTKFVIEPDRLAKQQLWHEIIQLKKQLTWHRSRDGVFYNEADGFDNIKNLGAKWFAKQKKLSSPIKFRVEVLNETMRAAEASFYPAFSELRHCYFDTDNHSYLSSLELSHRDQHERTSLWDSDVVHDAPLRIAADFGGSFNCIVVWQRHRDTIRIINVFWVKPPQILDHVFAHFAEYYRHHKNKQVLFWYDRTGNNAKDNSTLTSAQQATQVLQGYGWAVRRMTKGRAPHHEVKFRDANRVLLAEDPTLPRVLINGNRCKNLVTSILLSPLVMGARGEHKDKRNETKDHYPQEDATHLSDVFDIIIEAEISGASNTTSTPDMMVLG